jgi:histone-lysine N-methyltransferase SETMAR
MKSNRPGMLSNGIIILHDNAHPHTANSVRNTLQRFGWEVLQHPPYSPDLSLCDFHIFGDLKRDIHGHQFFKDGIDSLISQWDKCINSFGDYF